MTTSNIHGNVDTHVNVVTKPSRQVRVSGLKDEGYAL